MNCAIATLKRLQEKYHWPMEEVIIACEKKCTEHGLNFYDLVCECNQVLPTYGVASLKLIKTTPYIAYISFFKEGHYVLVEEVTKKVVIYDNLHQERKVNKFLFWLVWSKKAVVFQPEHLCAIIKPKTKEKLHGSEYCQSNLR